MLNVVLPSTQTSAYDQIISQLLKKTSNKDSREIDEKYFSSISTFFQKSVHTEVKNVELTQLEGIEKEV